MHRYFFRGLDALVNGESDKMNSKDRDELLLTYGYLLGMECIPAIILKPIKNILYPNGEPTFDTNTSDPSDRNFA